MVKKTELKKKKKHELVAMAEELGITNASNMNKDDLVEEIYKKMLEKEQKEKIEEYTEKIAEEVSKTISEASQTSVPPETPTVYYVEPTKELPEEYGETKIVLLVQDPWWVHVYWEIAPKDREKYGIPKGKHNKPLILRVYDITGVEDKFDGTNANKYMDIVASDETNNWYINVPEPDRSYCVDIGIIIDGKFVTIARSNWVKVPRASVSPYVDEEWMIPGEAILKASGIESLFSASGSAMLAKVVEINVPYSISSAEWFSSMAVPTPPVKEKKFWMEVYTELIVYGQTEPDATVTIFGEKIKLDKDGKFYVRMYLPDGYREIPIVGTSSDGTHSIKIVPIVEKRTEREEQIK